MWALLSDTEHIHVVQFQSHIKEARKNIETTFPDMFLEAVESPGEGLNYSKSGCGNHFLTGPNLFCAVPEFAGHWHPGAITGSRTDSFTQELTDFQGVDRGPWGTFPCLYPQ